MRYILILSIFLLSFQAANNEKLIFDGIQVNEKKTTLSILPAKLEIKEVTGNPELTIFHSRAGKMINEMKEINFPVTIDLNKYKVTKGDYLIIVMKRADNQFSTYEVAL